MGVSGRVVWWVHRHWHELCQVCTGWRSRMHQVWVPIAGFMQRIPLVSWKTYGQTIVSSVSQLALRCERQRQSGVRSRLQLCERVLHQCHMERRVSGSSSGHSGRVQCRRSYHSQTPTDVWIPTSSQYVDCGVGQKVRHKFTVVIQ